MEKEISIFYGCTGIEGVTAELNGEQVVRILRQPDLGFLIIGQASEEDVIELKQKGLVDFYNPCYRGPNLEDRMDEPGTFSLNLPRLNELLKSGRAKLLYCADLKEYSLDLGLNQGSERPWA